MFFSPPLLLARTSEFQLIWSVAMSTSKTKERRYLTRSSVSTVQVAAVCEKMMSMLPTGRCNRAEETQKLSLYLLAQLMFGVVRVHQSKTNYLFDDVNETYNRVKEIFRPSEIPKKRRKKHAGDENEEEEDELEKMLREANDFVNQKGAYHPSRMNIDVGPTIRNQARYEDITLRDEPVNTGLADFPIDDLEPPRFGDNMLLDDFGVPDMNATIISRQMASSSGDSVEVAFGAAGRQLPGQTSAPWLNPNNAHMLEDMALPGMEFSKSGLDAYDEFGDLNVARKSPGTQSRARTPLQRTLNITNEMVGMSIPGMSSPIPPMPQIQSLLDPFGDMDMMDMGPRDPASVAQAEPNAVAKTEDEDSEQRRASVERRQNQLMNVQMDEMMDIDAQPPKAADTPVLDSLQLDSQIEPVPVGPPRKRRRIRRDEIIEYTYEEMKERTVNYEDTMRSKEDMMIKIPHPHHRSAAELLGPHMFTENMGGARARLLFRKKVREPHPLDELFEMTSLAGPRRHRLMRREVEEEEDMSLNNEIRRKERGGMDMSMDEPLRSMFMRSSPVAQWLEQQEREREEMYMKSDTLNPDLTRGGMMDMDMDMNMEMSSRLDKRNDTRYLDGDLNMRERVAVDDESMQAPRRRASSFNGMDPRRSMLDMLDEPKSMIDRSVDMVNDTEHASGLPDKHSKIMLNKFMNECKQRDSDEIALSLCISGNDAKEAARSFYSVLVLLKNRKIDADQSEPYSEIFIQPFGMRPSQQEADDVYE